MENGATNNISVIEQESNVALRENRQQLAEQTAKINSEQDLSQEAKDRYIGEARQQAQAKYAEIIDSHDQAIRDRLEQNEKKLFAISYPQEAVTDTQKEAHRASYRQAAMSLMGASDEVVSRAMSRGLRTGDTVLQQAAYHESIERGLNEVGDEYRSRYDRAAEAWNVYARDRRAAESREHVLAGALLRAQDG